MAAVPIEWYRIPVDKGTLKSFTEKSDLKGFLQAGSFLLVFLATTAISFYFFWRHMWVAMVICLLPAFRVPPDGGDVRRRARAQPRHVVQDKADQRVLLQAVLFPHLEQPRPFPRQPRAASPVHRLSGDRQGSDPGAREGHDELGATTSAGSLSTTRGSGPWRAANVLHFLGKGNVDFFSWNPLFAEDDPRRKADDPLGAHRAAVLRRAHRGVQRVPPLGAHLSHHLRELLCHLHGQADLRAPAHGAGRERAGLADGAVTR